MYGVNVQAGWAIAGECGLYVDWRLTRRDMIEAHTSVLGCTWDECKYRGDRAVKILITYFKE